jgi:hypothetical protein
MADGPRWDGKVYKAVKFGDPFDWRTAEGQQRAARIREWRRTRDDARSADELDRLQWGMTPWPVKVIVTVIEGLLWPFKTFKRMRG